MWEPRASCMLHMEAICEPCAPSVSHVCQMGAMWEPDHTILEVDGALWKLDVPYGGQMEMYGSRM
jgi:hypothetical protein